MRVGGEGERLFERHRVVDVRYLGAARLLGRFKRDAAPALGTLGRCQREVLFRAAREHRRDAFGTELGRFLDAPFQMVELEDCYEQVHGKRGVGFKLFMQGEDDFAFLDTRDFRAMQEAVGDHVEDLPRLRAQHASEMCGLVAEQRSCGCGVGVGNEAAARHDVFKHSARCVRLLVVREQGQP